MSGRDAFGEEMGFLRQISDEDVERLLAGRGSGAHAPDLSEVASFLGAVGATVPMPPDAGIEAPLVRRLAEAARSAGDTAAAAPTSVVTATGGARKRGWRPRLALAAQIAVVVALLPATMAGLAFAGVTLPEPAREAMERIGLDLPNQSAVDEPTADDDGDDEASSHAREGSAVAGESNRGGIGKSAKKDKQKGEGSNKGKDAKGQPGAGHGNGSGGRNGQPAAAGPPIVPPGQGGTPPGQGGVPPTGGGGSPSAQPQGTGPPGGVPPGQAK